MSDLKRGSTGDGVKELQRFFGFEGSDVDGIFGPKTEAAVKEYQRFNGIAETGVVDAETKSYLGPTISSRLSGYDPTASSGTDNTNTSKALATTGGASYGSFEYDPIAGNALVGQAWSTLESLRANAPGEFTDPYKDQYMGYLNQYENRDSFSYDPNADALYQHYTDMYTQQGRMAMMDAMGQAAAMTGGYGNSYAQSVGQQAYNQQLGQLNDVMPELYGMAYDRYIQDGQDLLTQYSLYKGLSDQAYTKHQDELARYDSQVATATDYFTNLYDSEMNRKWNEYATARGEAFTASENEKSDLKAMIAAGYTPTDAELKKVGMSREQANYYASTAANADKKNTMPYEQQKIYEKDARVAVEENGVTGLYEIGKKMENEGYSDAFITKWMKDQLEILFPDTGNKKDNNWVGNAIGGIFGISAGAK